MYRLTEPGLRRRERVTVPLPASRVPEFLESCIAAHGQAATAHAQASWVLEGFRCLQTNILPDPVISIVVEFAMFRSRGIRLNRHPP